MPAKRAPDINVSLLDLLDRLLNTGVVVKGDLVISVADVDLIHIRLNLLLASVLKLTESAETGVAGPSPNQAPQAQTQGIVYHDR